MHNQLDEMKEMNMADRKSYVFISDNITRKTFDIITGNCNEDDCFTK